MSEAFGALLRRLRLATMIPGRRTRKNGPVSWVVTEPLSQNQLARLAQVDPALVNRYERGARSAPSRAVVLRLAAALSLDDDDTAALLVAAGYWPWPELSDDERDVALGVLLAVAAGDYRRLDGNDSFQGARRAR